jgi:hypothetical protein
VICDNKNSHRDSVNHRTDTVLTLPGPKNFTT